MSLDAKVHVTALKNGNARLREQLKRAEMVNLSKGEQLAAMTREKDNQAAAAEMHKHRADTVEGHYAVVVTLIMLASNAMRASK